MGDLAGKKRRLYLLAPLKAARGQDHSLAGPDITVPAILFGLDADHLACLQDQFSGAGIQDRINAPIQTPPV